MRASQLFLLVTVGAASLSLAASRTNAFGGDGPQDAQVPGRFMVRLAEGVTVGQFLAAVEADYPDLDPVEVDSIPSIGAYLFAHGQPEPPTLETDLRKSYQPRLLQWADLIYNGETPEGKTGNTYVDNIAPLSAFENQYARTKLNVAAAQQRSAGGGIVVAVLDTGIDASHPQLAGSIAPGGFNFITGTPNAADAGDGLDNDGDGDIDEMAGHGTYVAGLVSLVAPDARLLPITVLNSDGVGTNWTIVKGLQYAIDKGVEVVNMSLGSTYDSQGLFKTLEDAKNKGIVVVASAGNFNTADNREYPAMFDTESSDKDDEWLLFGVAATDEDDIKADFSNFHKNLFISSCGDSAINSQGQANLSYSIVSTLPGNEYRVWEGTSMAAPWVTGAAALIRAQHPEWPADASTWHAIRETLADTAVNIYPMNPAQAADDELGVGRIDIGAAVALGPTAPSTGDLNADGSVNVADLLKVIRDWGKVHTSADINGDGTVNTADLLLVVRHWG